MVPFKPQQIDVFLDTSVLLAAIFSERGGAREILRLGEARYLNLLVSQDVLQELEENIRAKVPARLADVAVLLDLCQVAVVAPPDITTVQQCQRFVQYADDAVVLAAAVAEQVSYFVTLDRQHFLQNNALRAQLSFPMGTPGEFLAWFRDKLATSQ